ncbi:MAG: hypothetical protein Q8R88_13500 [Desulfoprunum sp.]|nr:hypothetical protein [Desulfoprunum sp.]
MNEKEICGKHGEVSVWIVCRHVGEGSADTIIFSENRDALCFECARDFKNLTELDVVAMCNECLKDFTAKLMIEAKTFDILKNRVKGVEYLKGMRKDTSESAETL